MVLLAVLVACTARSGAAEGVAECRAPKLESSIVASVLNVTLAIPREFVRKEWGSVSGPERVSWWYRDRVQFSFNISLSHHSRPNLHPNTGEYANWQECRSRDNPRVRMAYYQGTSREADHIPPYIVLAELRLPRNQWLYFVGSGRSPAERDVLLAIAGSLRESDKPQ